MVFALLCLTKSLPGGNSIMSFPKIRFLFGSATRIFFLFDQTGLGQDFTATKREDKKTTDRSSYGYC